MSRGEDGRAIELALIHICTHRFCCTFLWKIHSWNFRSFSWRNEFSSKFSAWLPILPSYGMWSFLNCHDVFRFFVCGKATAARAAVVLVEWAFPMKLPTFYFIFEVTRTQKVICVGPNLQFAVAVWACASLTATRTVIISILFHLSLWIHSNIEFLKLNFWFVFIAHCFYCFLLLLLLLLIQQNKCQTYKFFTAFIASPKWVPPRHFNGEQSQRFDIQFHWWLMLLRCLRKSRGSER